MFFWVFLLLMFFKSSVTKLTFSVKQFFRISPKTGISRLSKNKHFIIQINLFFHFAPHPSIPHLSQNNIPLWSIFCISWGTLFCVKKDSRKQRFLTSKSKKRHPSSHHQLLRDVALIWAEGWVQAHRPKRPTKKRWLQQVHKKTKKSNRCMGEA